MSEDIKISPEDIKATLEYARELLEGLEDILEPKEEKEFWEKLFNRKLGKLKNTIKIEVRKVHEEAPTEIFSELSKDNFYVPIPLPPKKISFMWLYPLKEGVLINIVYENGLSLNVLVKWE